MNIQTLFRGAAGGVESDRLSIIPEVLERLTGAAMSKERVLIGTSVQGQPTVLATDGTITASQCAHHGSGVMDVGLITDTNWLDWTPGLYLWTGNWRWNERWTVHGSLRPVAPEEIVELYALKPKE